MPRRIVAMSKPPKPQLQRIFEERTKSIYHLMVARVEEKRNQDGKIIRYGRTIPFSVQELQAWVLTQFGPGGWDDVARCAYCNAVLNVQTFVLDHEIPMAAPWNGDLGLGNLACACAQCNRRKGCMSAAGFRKLIAFLGGLNLDRRDVSDVWSRLGTGGEGAKAMWKRKRPKQR